ncbi:MAG: hypothetical protein WC372_07085 [Candidatus Neomarinimicrobiota bacterium]|jgi:hypothetical protein|nr:hypothetical protein [Candidatus Neomarinimicrobiota bacterium]MDX9779927.1 hypothetical protein [bacterium]
MLAFSIVFFIFAVVIYLWPVLSIYYFLKRRDEKTRNFIFFSLNPIYYLKRYRKLTKIKNGQTGRLYFFWFFSLGLSVLLVLLGLFCNTIS